MHVDPPWAPGVPEYRAARRRWRVRTDSRRFTQDYVIRFGLGVVAGFILGRPAARLAAGGRQVLVLEGPLAAPGDGRAGADFGLEPELAAIAGVALRDLRH